MPRLKFVTWIGSVLSTATLMMRPLLAVKNKSFDSTAVRKCSSSADKTYGRFPSDVPSNSFTSLTCSINKKPRKRRFKDSSPFNNRKVHIQANKKKRNTFTLEQFSPKLFHSRFRPPFQSLNKEGTAISFHCPFSYNWNGRSNVIKGKSLETSLKPTLRMCWHCPSASMSQLAMIFSPLVSFVVPVTPVTVVAT